MSCIPISCGLKRIIWIRLLDNTSNSNYTLKGKKNRKTFRNN